MDNLQQEQVDLMNKGLETVPIDELTPKVEAALRLKDSTLNSTQAVIVLLNLTSIILTKVIDKDPPADQKKELERMVKECNDTVIKLAYSLGVHDDSSSIPRLTEKH